MRITTREEIMGSNTTAIEVGYGDTLNVFRNEIDDREFWLDATDSFTHQFVEIQLTDKGRKQLRKALKK